MSCNYAEGLSSYENKGKCGLPEIFDSPSKVDEKVKRLAEWMRGSKHTVLHTGAGISTAAGIPDFRGPKGVWTLEQKGEKPQVDMGFSKALPTKTHISWATEDPVKTVGQKLVGQACFGQRDSGRPCRGKLRDNILDWEDRLPERDMQVAQAHSLAAQLSICLGTTLQIVPSGNLPVLTKKTKGRLVICNLQPTKHDRKADLLIHTYVDDMMEKLCSYLDVRPPEYKPKMGVILEPMEWTVRDEWLKDLPKVELPQKKRKRRGKPFQRGHAKRERSHVRAKPEFTLLKKEPKEEEEEEEDEEGIGETPFQNGDDSAGDTESGCIDSKQEPMEQDDVERMDEGEKTRQNGDNSEASETDEPKSAGENMRDRETVSDCMGKKEKLSLDPTGDMEGSKSHSDEGNARQTGNHSELPDANNLGSKAGDVRDENEEAGKNTASNDADCPVWDHEEMMRLQEESIQDSSAKEEVKKQEMEDESRQEVPIPGSTGEN
ncbi:unnamed protein product [Darwinula stevensoni]|uniref:protein acetyllysine N-acetyltransferase n=1 Tax=Darwinula stevensoni TaxID=69355 RepID=A0A7R9AAK0_9CRUS|nr:unnamed protein product [Darwinula stevensoni]CAG0898322.1 unnamed protein product [Darwinula stevensoni]